MPRKSSTPFTYYSFRFDYETEKQKNDCKDLILRECPKYAIFDEVSDEVGKHHLQGKIGKEMSDEQLRKRFKAALPNYFNKSNYSLAHIMEPENYDSYICKDGNVVINNIFSQEYIDAQVQKRVEKKVAFENKKQKQKSSVPFTQKVAFDFVSENPSEARVIQQSQNLYKVEEKAMVKAHEDLLKFLLKRLGKAAKVFDDNVLQRMYTGVKNYIIQLDENASNFYADRVKNSIDLYR